MLPHDPDRYTIGKGNPLNQLTEKVDCPQPDKASSSPSLDQLLRLTATFFDIPIAAIFVRKGDRLLLKASSGLQAQTSSELERICSSAINDNAPIILNDMGTLQASPALANLGVFSSLRFCACFPLETPHGHPVAAISIGDVDARIEFSEENLGALEAFSAIAADLLTSQLAEQDRRASASAIAALCHDVRTPINGVLGMAELLLASKDLGEKPHRRAETIKRSGATLLSMIEPIFDVAKCESDESRLVLTPVNLKDLVVKELRRTQDNVPCEMHSLELTCNFADDLNVSADAAKLKKLLSYFFDAAAILSDEGPAKIEVAYQTSASNVHVTIGIAELKLEEERLSSLTALLSHEGQTSPVGLGALTLKLLVSRQLARAMRGDITASHSDRNLMSLRLEVTLQWAPSVEGPLVDASSDSYDGKTTQGNDQGIDVLVAEDDPDMAFLIKECLEEDGHRATVAPSGKAVMTILDQKNIDIVLMDGRLADMSGLEVAGKIRALPDGRSTLPIIALTGDVMEGDRERYLASGMNDYLAKPVDYNSLVEMIDQYGNSRP
jgi:CheY-like chemotaxis protein/signal transduction histidine kinase